MTQKKGLDGLTLKLLAAAAMVVDHIGIVFFPEAVFLRCIGRLALPIFAFLIAEGFAHTRDFAKYLRRMALFALAAELPYNLLRGGSVWNFRAQNVLFTFCIALLTLHFMEKCKCSDKPILWMLTLLAGGIFAEVLGADYGAWGVFTVAAFALSRGKERSREMQFAEMLLINGFLMDSAAISFGAFHLPVQAFALLALPLIWAYNGAPGAGGKAVRLGFYAFYPAHLLALEAISHLR